MRNTEKRKLRVGTVLLIAFAVWTILIQFVDVQPVGLNGTRVGLATFNVWFHRLTGAHMVLYTLTDWLGLVPVVVCLCFGMLGLTQLIRRKNLLQVDGDILLLGVYYILVVFLYLIFEMFPINYRPILIDGLMEASYPSSTTLLVLSVMLTLRFQAARRSRNRRIRIIADAFSIVFSAFMVLGRLVAGVHWATDIIGSVLLSFGIYMLYQFCVDRVDRRRERGQMGA